MTTSYGSTWALNGAYHVAQCLRQSESRRRPQKRLEPDRGASDKEIIELITNLASPKPASRDPALKVSKRSARV